MSTSDWSLPETDVFDRIRTTLEAESEAVLATVIAVEGSAYRRPGAKMLLSPDGPEVGSITAGCLEDEVRALAADVLADGAPRVETWDLTGDDDVWGLGVGCNGVITVLLEPLGESYRPVVDAYRAGETIGVLTVVGGEADAAIGDRTYYRPNDGFEDETFPEAIQDELEAPLGEVIDAGDAETVSIDSSDGNIEVYVEGVRPPPELVVFGSGHDIDPVVKLAKLVDFRVTVVSFRGGQADADRVPRADAVMSASPREVGELRQWDRDTYAVVMSHNFLDDRFALEQLLETPVPYIGLMGPRKRFDEMREEFTEEGRTFTEAELERVYTPIGLSLGGDAPFQIAFSIVAELLAVAHDRTPQHLTQRIGPIHDRIDITPD
ncbi:XdhC family protein [Halalkalicoccus jeotgali]|uniref:Xanthine and Co dehydrogenase maturation factor n=1 Tax=Halalkalicoccus jeotgali (strain DSM 18796 / CECT 7217 / JCM 14584 / KCTC 4019 / B3) TaxID=795797 RepID=D8JBB2_HALJB|nr:XdhC/CoxI family protein [Halalkalicoccus jeotgali]ADJ16565.1 xanthine and Co dehydrogenase maturation factor [Halalkalicoccus jeotgali B3]ELY41339.1 xanthine and Co dehydrogenase maturation factor [Halalkalicoccus jeotgali B3]